MSNTFQTGKGLSFHELNRLADAMAGKYMFPESAGGAVTTSSGLTVAVAAIAGNTVTINGSLVSTAYAGGTVTASAADATNPRRDIVYYDTSGAVGVAAGTAAATPHVPTLTSTQIAVAELYVAANSVTISAGDIADRRQQMTGAKKTSGAGYFAIPTLPAVGTTVTTSASANTYGSWTEMTASTSAALYIVGISINAASGTENYAALDIGTGAGGAESSVSSLPFNIAEGVTEAKTIMLPAWIAVAASTRIACRTAGSEAAARGFTVSLICINQSNVATI